MARLSEVVPTIEDVHVPTQVFLDESWTGYFYLCNRGTRTGNVSATISGDVEGRTPIIEMGPGDCQIIAIGGRGPANFHIRAG